MSDKIEFVVRIEKRSNGRLITAHEETSGTGEEMTHEMGFGAAITECILAVSPTDEPWITDVLANAVIQTPCECDKEPGAAEFKAAARALDDCSQKWQAENRPK